MTIFFQLVQHAGGGPAPYPFISSKQQICPSVSQKPSRRPCCLAFKNIFKFFGAFANMFLTQEDISQGYSYDMWVTSLKSLLHSEGTIDDCIKVSQSRIKFRVLNYSGRLY